jgi:hypothetical protein
VFPSRLSRYSVDFFTLGNKLFGTFDVNFH